MEGRNQVTPDRNDGSYEDQKDGFQAENANEAEYEATDDHSGIGASVIDCRTAMATTTLAWPQDDSNLLFTGDEAVSPVGSCQSNGSLINCRTAKATTNLAIIGDGNKLLFPDDAAVDPVCHRQSDCSLIDCRTAKATTNLAISGERHRQSDCSVIDCRPAYASTHLAIYNECAHGSQEFDRVDVPVDSDDAGFGSDCAVIDCRIAKATTNLRNFGDDDEDATRAIEDERSLTPEANDSNLHYAVGGERGDEWCNCRTVESHPHGVYGTALYPYANRTREFKFSGEATKEKYAEKTKDVKTNYLNWVKIIKQDADAALDFHEDWVTDDEEKDDGVTNNTTIGISNNND